MKELKEEQDVIKSELSNLDVADEKFYISANRVLNLCSRAYEIFKSSEPNEKRQLLNFLFQNSVLQGKKPVFMLKKPFDEVVNATKCSKWLPLWNAFRTYYKQDNEENLTLFVDFMSEREVKFEIFI